MRKRGGDGSEEECDGGEAGEKLHDSRVKYLGGEKLVSGAQFIEHCRVAAFPSVRY